MTLEEMMVIKKEKKLTCESIARASGVPLSTVQKIFSGSTKEPRQLTLDALARALGGEGEGGRSYTQRMQTNAAEGVREPLVSCGAVRKEERHTIDDYYALPEDVRVELIDGVFYDMGAPALKHQRILGDLFVLFRECAERHGMPCEVYLSPCDVRLDRDNYTMVQPDLLVICGEYDAEGIRYEGAPDLVVEILSPSTRRKDLTLKLFKYQNAGVREYWVIDPMFRQVTVHYFEDENYHPEPYDFDAEIPVRISGGECCIDFSRVRGN